MSINVANKLLLKLLNQVERGGRETLPITERSAKDFFKHNDLNSREKILAVLKNAQQAGTIKLEWGQGAATQDLKRLRVLDADKLAIWLGVSRANSRTENITQTLQPLLLNAPSWLVDAFEKAKQKWHLGKPWLGIQNNEYREAETLFRIALAVSRNEQDNLDLRRFSVKLLGDSKAIEKRMSRIANLLRENPEWQGIKENKALFRLLGLEKFPPPLFLKGPLRIDYDQTDWNISELRPFIGLSPDMIRGVSLTHHAPYLLTIENLASFQRHVREINDDGIVIYTGGFPAPALMKLLNRFDKILSESCHFFHWGDQDPGGLRILLKVEEAYTLHAISQHLMIEISDGQKPFTPEQQQAILNLVSDENQAGRLANQWIENENLGLLEQEFTNPKSPV